MERYILRYTDDIEKMEEGIIENCPWGGTYRPVTRFRAGWQDDHLRVWMCCEEHDPLRRYTKPNESVWCDSCMEFFVAPDENGYYNFEMNANGALLLMFNESGKEPVFSDFPRERIPLRAQVSEDRWTLDLTVPFALFPSFKAEHGKTLRGNFYKCGDETETPHYLCRFPIDPAVIPAPNFHRPEYFGELVLQ